MQTFCSNPIALYGRKYQKETLLSLFLSNNDWLGTQSLVNTVDDEVEINVEEIRQLLDDYDSNTEKKA